MASSGIRALPAGSEEWAEEGALAAGSPIGLPIGSPIGLTLNNENETGDWRLGLLGFYYLNKLNKFIKSSSYFIFMSLSTNCGVLNSYVTIVTGSSNTFYILEITWVCFLPS